MTASKSPLLILAFNRPKILGTLLNSLVADQLKDRNVYFSVDGPRNTEEKILVQQVLDLITSFSDKNNLPVTLWRSSKNNGCKLGVSQAITKVLKKEETVIILEDDCLPSKSFLPYCDYLLNKYKKDTSVYMVNGCTFSQSEDSSFDYRRSKCAFVWGWATWRRAWWKYDVDMTDLNFPYEDNKTILKIKDYYGRFSNSLASLIIKVKSDKIDTWDAQWAYSIWRNNGYTLLPSVNLISNIGFGGNSTHTKIITDLSNRKHGELRSYSRQRLIGENTMMQLDREQYGEVQSSTSPLKLLISYVKHYFMRLT